MSSKSDLGWGVEFMTGAQKLVLHLQRGASVAILRVTRYTVPKLCDLLVPKAGFTLSLFSKGGVFE